VKVLCKYGESKSQTLQKSVFRSIIGEQSVEFNSGARNPPIEPLNSAGPNPAGYHFSYYTINTIISIRCNWRYAFLQAGVQKDTRSRNSPCLSNWISDKTVIYTLPYFKRW